MKITVCYSQPSHIVNSKYYVPIHCGRAGSKVALDMLGDDTGENISFKNGAYSELTAMYWEWKNNANAPKNKIVGLCHYRRYFDFHNKYWFRFGVIIKKWKYFEEFDFDIPGKIKEKVQNGAVLVARPRRYNQCLRDAIVLNVPEVLMQKFESYFMETQDKDMRDSFNEVMYHRNYLMAYNMFLMRCDDFEEYCFWLFPLFEEFERYVNINRMVECRFRFFGYLSERLFNVWLLCENKTLLYKLIVWFDDNRNSNSSFAHKIKVLMKSIGL